MHLDPKQVACPLTDMSCFFCVSRRTIYIYIDRERERGERRGNQRGAGEEREREGGQPPKSMHMVRQSAINVATQNYVFCTIEFNRSWKQGPRFIS
jgi:hypothetical protein